MALYTKSYAWKRYLAMLTFLVALQYVFNIFGLAQLPPLAQAAQIWMVYNVIKYMCPCCCCKADEAPPDLESTLSPLSPNSLKEDIIMADSTPQPKRERLYYLDNLKVFLTFMVITHHVVCTFSGGGWVWNFNAYDGDGDGDYVNYTKTVGTWILTLNQMYFMCMFFFISGYFTPPSFRKKGAQAFLKDKFKRLGIPYVVVSWIYFPICILSSIYMIKSVGSIPGAADDDTVTDLWYYACIPNPGPLWFVGWLCIFSYLYANVDHSEPTVMSCPSPLKLLCWSVPLSILNFALIGGLGSFMYMPIAQGSLPFDILFFYGGCIANNNKWLDRGTPGGLVEIMEDRRTKIWTYGTFILAAGGALPFLLSGPSQEAVVIAQFLLCTLGIALIFYVELDFFRLYFNFTGPISKLLSKAAYAAYIIHPIFVNLSSYLFLKVYQGSTGDDGVVFIAHNLTSTSEFTAEDAQGWLMGGMFTASAFAVVTTFVTAHFFRQLPGCREIL
ncbi:hypothetical protein TrRE_jg7237 [Triparma retinervis]|uniref:Acyltransferase 3 domain-containing protein n=1 Tax=Triparma retinervis TaxID=2557542 RepID=A0A9W7CJ72_9STRA|nr:hypothetical protein TrRE_jg7237 [Triparma retinervis]